MIKHIAWPLEVGNGELDGEGGWARRREGRGEYSDSSCEYEREKEEEVSFSLSLRLALAMLGCTRKHTGQFPTGERRRPG